MSDEQPPIVPKRETLHLPPKAKLNGSGVVRRPSGEVRMEQVVEELQNPAPPERGG